MSDRLYCPYEYLRTAPPHSSTESKDPNGNVIKRRREEKFLAHFSLSYPSKSCPAYIVHISRTLQLITEPEFLPPRPLIFTVLCQPAFAPLTLLEELVSFPCEAAIISARGRHRTGGGYLYQIRGHVRKPIARTNLPAKQIYSKNRTIRLLTEISIPGLRKRGHAL